MIVNERSNVDTRYALQQDIDDVRAELAALSERSAMHNVQVDGKIAVLEKHLETVSTVLFTSVQPGIESILSHVRVVCFIAKSLAALIGLVGTIVAVGIALHWWP